MRYLINSALLLLIFLPLSESLLLADPSLKPSIAFAGLGCAPGFGGVIFPSPPPEEQKKCDRASLAEFKKYLGHCFEKWDLRAGTPPPMYTAFETNQDSCITCDDYYIWKGELEELFQRNERSIDASLIILKECDDTAPAILPTRPPYRVGKNSN